MTKVNLPHPNGRRRLWRRWLLRGLAVATGLLPLIVAELALRWADYPPPAAIDPYVDLHQLRPLFEPVPGDPQRVHIAPERLHLFRPVSFTRHKPPDTIRVFALGGSTTQGEPYSTETAFPRWFGEAMQLADPTHRYEVINCGGLSYASYRVLAVLREVMQYEPDWILVYTGHNEFLERRTYDHLQEKNWKNQLLSRTRRLHTVRALGELFRGARPAGDRSTKPLTVIQSEVDALLDYRGGLDAYHRGDPWMQGVVPHFAWNLEQMLRLCRQARVPLILIRPVSNLADCPPFKIEPPPNLPPDRLEAFQSLWDAARGEADPSRAAALANQVLALDPEHAGAHYLLGRLAYERNDAAEADRHLVLARDFDVCPLRATTPVLEVIDRLARRYQCVFVDAEQLFAVRSHLQIVGNQWLVDHIHPSIEGHQLLGHEIARACINNGMVDAPESNWAQEVDERFRDLLLQLDESYFHRARQRLEGLRLWTQGRANKIRSAAPYTAD
ncbi:MAG: hypothetical protein KatS3mg111_4262 [Pirellulaceae bacterium]|nr:MAG: hypothetical protein KatS3mg111_4262 [Pirellulaceae bacterium]